MSFSDERRAIETRLADNFSALPIWYENQKFDIPAGTPWVKITILNGAGRQASINSSPLQRYVGVIQIDVFVKQDSGTATARTHADTIEAIFRNAQFSAGSSGTITCRTPSITPVPDQDEWYQLSVSVSYHRDVTHS